MNKSQASVKNMYMVLRSLIAGTDLAVLATMPNFDGWYAQWNDLVDTLSQLIEIQRRDRRGKAAVKADRRELLTIQGLALCAIMKSYSMAIEDLDLENLINYPKSTLERYIEVDFIAAITTILNTVTTLQPNLVAYGVLPLTVTNFGDLFNDYLTSAPLPKISKDEKKAATSGIKTAIKGANALLVKLDSAVETLLLTNFGFYTDYFDARTRESLPTRINLVRGKVVDVDGNPLGLVTMVCDELDIHRKISPIGGFIIRHAEDGTYEFVFSRTGYQTVTQSVGIYNGTRTEVLVVMHLHV